MQTFVRNGALTLFSLYDRYCSFAGHTQQLTSQIRSRIEYSYTIIRCNAYMFIPILFIITAFSVFYCLFIFFLTALRINYFHVLL